MYIAIWSIEKLSTDDPDLKKKECNWQATKNNKLYRGTFTFITHAHIWE